MVSRASNGSLYKRSSSVKYTTRLDWKIGSAEMIRSFSKQLFVNALQKLIPDIRLNDLEKGGSGVRAQALSIDGKLLDDFKIVNRDKIIHVLNAPSPAATSAFSIAKHIVSYCQA